MEDNQAIYELSEYIIDPNQEPMRIDKYLQGRLENVTRNRIQRAIDEGWVLVNGKNIKSNHKVKPGQVVNVRWKRQKRIDGALPQQMDLDIRFEDNEFMIIHKPAGLVVHPGIGNEDGTLVNGLAYHMKDLPISQGNERPGIVHRIDKNTTGLMVIAKTEEAMTHLAKQFFDHSIERRYHALVWGDLKEDEGTIEGHIDRHPNHRRLRHVYKDGERGKHAITHYKVLRRFGYVTLVECKLETGRTHQIRVHFKHLGHPLFGDKEYGGDRIVKGTVFTKYKQFVLNCFKLIPHQALHAKSLGLVHPVTGEFHQFDSDLPDFFEAVLDRWEAYTESRLKQYR
jgi:23S rRNA pseudouridine1911/1915/1917 synthase